MLWYLKEMFLYIKGTTFVNRHTDTDYTFRNVDLVRLNFF